MSRKFIEEVKGNEAGHGKPWAVISLTLWLSSWKEKSTSDKSTLVVFLYSRTILCKEQQNNQADISLFKATLEQRVKPVQSHQ